MKLAILLILFFGLGACGQKGPLYLPGDKPEQGANDSLVEPKEIPDELQAPASNPVNPS